MFTWARADAVYACTSITTESYLVPVTVLPIEINPVIVDSLFEIHFTFLGLYSMLWTMLPAIKFYGLYCTAKIILHSIPEEILNSLE